MGAIAAVGAVAGGLGGASGLIGALSTIGTLVSTFSGLMGGGAPDSSGIADAMSKQAAAEQKQAELQNRQNEIKARNDRVQAIRKARVDRGKILAMGAANNVSGSSSVLGGAGSVQSQLSHNLGLSSQLQDLENQRVAQETLAIKFGHEAQAAQINAQAEMSGSNGSGIGSLFQGLASAGSSLFGKTA